MVEDQAECPHLADHDLSPLAGTALGAMRPTPRMAASGRLMTGVKASTSYMPRLVMVKVPPVRSSGSERPLRGPLHQLAELGAELAQALLVGVADHRHEQAALGIHSHAHVDVAQELDGIRGQAGVHVGELAQRRGHDLGQQVVVAGGKAPVLLDLFLEPRPGESRTRWRPLR